MLPSDLTQIAKTVAVRKQLAYSSMRHFFAFYLHHYMAYDLAPFHHDFFELAEDETSKLSVILAFRGSAKSTFFSLCYPIWAITGKQQKKYVVIFTQTQQQAKKILENIKQELESNELLVSDIGPFEGGQGEWSAMSIVIKNYNARILVASVDQSVRGLRHAQFRPDLIILDDIADLASTRTAELRQKLMEWYTSEVIPLGDRKTKIVVIGTKLHEDDLYSQLIQSIQAKKLKGVCKIIPITNAKGQTSWPGKYPNKKVLDEQKALVMNEVTWQREYMLQIIYDDDYIYTPKDFVRYGVLPLRGSIRYLLLAVDLAISKSSSADKTAMVAVYITGYAKELRGYVCPMVINKRLGFTDMIADVKQFQHTVAQHIPTFLLVEKVAYQQAAIEQLQIEGFEVNPVSPNGQDKRARLTAVSPLVKTGTILFPDKGTEVLEQQLVDFGIEKHDDLADAFAYIATYIQGELTIPEPQLRWL